MNLNKAMLIGNLTRDPEVRQTPTGQSVATFAIATNLVWVDQAGQKQEKVEFHNIVAWRKLADICGRYLKKGAKVYLEGRLQTRDWVGKDGLKRYTTEIVAENMIMLDSRNTNQGSGPSNDYGRSNFSQPTAVAAEPIINYGDESTANSNNDFGPEEEEIKVENIPF